MCIMPYSSELMIAYATRIPSSRAYPLLVSSLCQLVFSMTRCRRAIYKQELPELRTVLCKGTARIRMKSGCRSRIIEKKRICYLNPFANISLRVGRGDYNFHLLL